MTIYEDILNELLLDAKDAMNSEYAKLIAAGGFEAEGNPLGTNDAVRILQALMHVAHDFKNRIDGRLMEGVIKGGVYESYCSDIAKMNRLNSELESAAHRRRDAHKEFLHSQAEYDAAMSGDAAYVIDENQNEAQKYDDHDWGGMFDD